MKLSTLLAFLFLLSLSCNQASQKEKTPETKPSNGDSIPNSKTEPTSNPYAGIDVSPMDMSYYPADYPKLKMTNPNSTPPLVRLIYSRPHLQGRHLFHEVLKYDEPWRLGANEASEIDFYNDVTIQDKKIKAGRYIIYCIPHPGKWSIVLNSNIDSWGLQQDATKDVARFIVPVQETSNHLEYYTMVFEKKDAGAELIMAWDNLEARLGISFK